MFFQYHENLIEPMVEVKDIKLEDNKLQFVVGNILWVIAIKLMYMLITRYV